MYISHLTSRKRMISDLCIGILFYTYRYAKEQLMCVMITSAKLLEYSSPSPVTVSVYEKKKGATRQKKLPYRIHKKYIPRGFKEDLKLL